MRMRAMDVVHAITAVAGLTALGAALACWNVVTRAAETSGSVKHIQTANSGIAQAVWVGDMLYLSGQTASPVTPADGARGEPAVFGDTKTQSMNVFSKIAGRLKEQGLRMSDVVMMHVYLVGDPANGGELDFAGMNAAYGMYFGTDSQPIKPARTTVQVAALASRTALVEIEVIAARSR